jgi:hypothetical protein
MNGEAGRRFDGLDEGRSVSTRGREGANPRWLVTEEFR